MSRRWLRIAHRGASSSAPELTRPAFQLALDLGVDMIELDVQVSRDQELVVIHDLELERTTTGAGRVRDHSLAQLRVLDTGAWFDAVFAGQRLLTVDDVAELVGTRAGLNIELKAPREDWPTLVTKLDILLRMRGMLSSTIVSCFDPEGLLAMRRRCAGARLGLLWEKHDLSAAWEWARELRVVSIHPQWQLADGDLVERAHAMGIQVLVWTVNDIENMGRLVARGVDGIMSDCPERFSEVPSQIDRLTGMVKALE